MIAGLERYRGQNRVLVIFGDAQASDYRAQAQIVETDSAGLNDRDMVVFGVLDSEIAAIFGQAPKADPETLRGALTVAPGAFRVVLIGKDGGVKHAQEAPLAAQDLFAQIDAMPMRQSEMRERD